MTVCKFLTLFCILTALSIAPTARALDDKCLLSACNVCTCYFSSECGGTQSCSYTTGCTDSGKLDGQCVKSGTSGGFTTTQRLDAATALGLWFEAYKNPTKEEGLPDANIIKKIRAFGMGEEQERRIRDAAFNAIDVVLGFDFVQPRGNCFEYDERCLGIFRVNLSEDDTELLNALQSGLAQGLRNGDANTLAKRIRVFWERFPKYKPHHTGRCYPHGHREYPHKSAKECQIDELSRILSDLLTPASSVNTERESYQPPE